MKQINEKVGHQNKCLTFAKKIITMYMRMCQHTEAEEAI